MFGSLDPAKLFVILVVALIVLGPERLPRAARQLGAAWRELTRLREQVSEEVRAAIPEVDVPRITPGTVSGFFRDLTAPADPAAAPDELHDADPELADPLEVDLGTEPRSVPAPLATHGSSGAPAGFLHAPDDPGMN